MGPTFQNTEIILASTPAITRPSIFMLNLILAPVCLFPLLSFSFLFYFVSFLFFSLLFPSFCFAYCWCIALQADEKIQVNLYYPKAANQWNTLFPQFTSITLSYFLFFLLSSLLSSLTSLLPLSLFLILLFSIFSSLKLRRSASGCHVPLIEDLSKESSWGWPS